MLEPEGGPAGAPEAEGEAAAWLRVSIGGIEVLKVDAGVSWRSLLEAEEGDRE